MANQKQKNVPDLVPINGSTNVYVGQRYVPKFYDDGTEQHGATWDKTKVYEPLTIVLWNGDSYTSRTFVPAGVEIADTRYWLQTGLFNAQLQGYINKVNDVTTDVSEIRENLEHLSKTSLNKNRYVVILGDSWATGFNETTGWLELMTNLNYFNIKHVKNARGGCAYGNRSNDWKRLLTDTIVPDKEEVTEIYICGGSNDNTASKDSVIVGMNDLATYVKENYPNATLINIMLRLGVNETKITEYISASNECGIICYPCTDVTNWLGTNIWTASQHPKQAFQIHISKHVADQILWGHSYAALEYTSATLTLKEGFTSAEGIAGKMHVLMANGVKNFNFGAVTLSGSFSDSTKYYVGEASPEMFPLNSGGVLYSWQTTGFLINNNIRYPANIFYELTPGRYGVTLSVYPVLIAKDNNTPSTFTKLAGGPGKLTFSSITN